MAVGLAVRVLHSVDVLDRRLAFQLVFGLLFWLFDFFLRGRAATEFFGWLLGRSGQLDVGRALGVLLESLDLVLGLTEAVVNFNLSDFLVFVGASVGLDLVFDGRDFVDHARVVGKSRVVVGVSG